MPADRKADSSKRAAARRRIEEKRAAEATARAAAQRRRRTIIGAVTAGVVVLVALLVVVAVQTHRTSTAADAPVPQHTADNGTAFPVGAPGAKVTVDLYEDFQCPTCKAFETLTGPTVADLVSKGTITVNYRPVAILDRASSTRYSTRSLNAAGVVADAAGTDAFTKFHDLLYANQPPEGSAGLTDDQLIAYANQAGASGPAVESGIRSLRFQEWTKKVTDAASKAGLQGTPTILINGKQLDLQDANPQGFTAAVNAAAQR